MCLITPLQLPETDHYLTKVQHGVVTPGIVVGTSTSYTCDVAVRRAGAKVWGDMTKGGFNASTCTTAADARRIGEAWLKAAEDAEEFERQERDRQGQLDDDAWAHDMEMDLAREAEERGEEYVPTAIGVGHMNGVEFAMLHGGPLRPWQEELKPTGWLQLFRLGAGGRFSLDEAEKKAATWFRWHEVAHPMLHVWNVTHDGLDLNANHNAAVDDFGTLVIVPKEVHL